MTRRIARRTRGHSSDPIVRLMSPSDLGEHLKPFVFLDLFEADMRGLAGSMPALQALADGYDVFVVTDASGGVTAEAHDMAVRRMVAAGAVPMTWMAVLGEWQRDWAREKTAVGVAGVVAEHGGGSGVAFAWEMQLLASHASAGR